jgi:hypothetical protein
MRRRMLVTFALCLGTALFIIQSGVSGQSPGAGASGKVVKKQAARKSGKPSAGLAQGKTSPSAGAKTKRSSAQAGSAAKDRGRYLIPGIGGAVPPRTQPSGFPSIPDLMTRFGPQRPKTPNETPAAVTVPGQGLPGLPQTGTGGLPSLQARQVSPLIYGVNVVWGDSGGGANWDKDNGAKARRLAQLMKGAGVTNTRIGIGWADVERTRGKYDWRETDRFVRYVSGLGVTLICVVDVVPDWALDRSPDVLKLFRDRGVSNLAGVRAPQPEFYADLGRFAYACAQRYKDRIKRWEFWNEPDGMGMPFVVKNAEGKPVDIRYGGDPKVYTDLLKIFYRNVKRADPEAQVAVGGLQVLKTDFLAGIYADDGRSYFDAVALHPYNDRNLIAFDWIDRCRELLVKNRDEAKSFWLTEWGWGTAPGNPGGIGELQQARLIRESLAGMRARPFITQASYHTLNDWRTDERNPGSLIAMGLCGYELKPKPGYYAFREVATGLPAEPGRSYARVNLTGGLPSVEEGDVRATTAGVFVDADRPGEPMPPIWEGFSQGSVSVSPGFFEAAVPRLKALNARLVRFDPFPNPDSVKTEGANEGAGEGATPVNVALSPSRPLAPSRIDWRYADSMVDAVTRAGAKPMLSFGTMPTALSASVGNARLPRDPAQWAAFIQGVVRRYNVEQKRGIVYWELSCEPDERGGPPEEWLRFYETFARAVLSADPSAKVGGPSARSGMAWVRNLADYCARRKVPLNFLSWQAYGHSPEDLARQVREMRAELRRNPPLADVELIVNEWNASEQPSPRNDDLSGAVYAASVVEQLAGVAPVKALFYEVKETPDFRRPAEIFTGRWGLLTHNDQPKPVYNAFRLLGHLEGLRLPAATDDAEVHALASRGKDHVSILIWPQPDRSNARTPERADSPVLLRIRGLPWKSATRGELMLLDSTHGNAQTRPERSELQHAAVFRAPAGDVEIPIVLSQYGMTLVELSGAAPSPVEVTLDTPRFVVYRGGRFTVTATLRSASSKPQTVSLFLSGSDPAVIPATARTRRVVVPAGASALCRFDLRAPSEGGEAQEFFQITATPESKIENRKSKIENSIAVKFASPLKVRLEPERVDVARPGARADSVEATAQFRAILENLSDVSVKAGLVSGSTSQAITVPARNAATVPFSVPAPANLPGNYDAPVKILLGEKIAATLDARIGVPALCRYASRTPRINGELSEWEDSFPITLDRESQVREKRWGGPQDLSAQAFTMWDEQNFYLAVTVTDDIRFQLFAPEEMWRGDSVQFALDVRRSASPEQEGYDDGDYEFGIAAGRIRANVYRFAGGGKPPALVTTAQAAVARVGNRTLYEAAIPWSELAPMRPVENAIAGFSLLVNDSDGQGRGYIEWAGGIGDAKRPGKFIGLRLVKD